MELFVRYLLIFGSIQLLDARRFPCDYTHSPEARGWLKLHQTAATAPSAMQLCSSEGARLAAPANVDLQRAMLMMMAQNIHTVHTGLPAVYDKTYGNGLRALQNDETFKIVQPSESYPFFCFVADADAVSQCGSNNDGYELDSRTGKCYKFHRVHFTWDQAQATCSREGAHLAVLNSAAEAAAMRDLFGRNPPESIPGCCWKDVAFVGFRKKYNQWLTIFDQTLSNAGYASWEPREPNNANGDEFCGSIGRNALLFDDPCERGLPFICERASATVTLTCVG